MGRVDGINPRVVLFLKVHELPMSTIAPRAPGVDIPRVQQGEWLLPWTAAYSLWIMGRWRTWAEELGFKGDHNRALLAGHTAADFDDWLATEGLVPWDV